MTTTTGAKHTPEPLHAAEYETHYAVKRGSETLATGIRKEADAKLYAAAPDLLAACKAISARYESDLSQYDRDPTEIALVEQARAAIAKAETGGAA